MGMVIEVRDLQLYNKYWLRLVTPLGMVMAVMAVEPNAYSPMLLTVEGIEMEASLESFRKHLSPITSSPVLSVTVVRLLHPARHWVPRDVTVAAMFAEVILVQFVNAYAERAVTPELTTTDLTEVRWLCQGTPFILV